MPLTRKQRLNFLMKLKVLKVSGAAVKIIESYLADYDKAIAIEKAKVAKLSKGRKAAKRTMSRVYSNRKRRKLTKKY